MEHDTKAPDSPAVAGLVERTVRPCAWTASSWLASRSGGHFVPERRHAFDVPLYDRAALDALLALLKRCRPIIEADAQMMADISRHAPLDADSQAKHDATEYESEKLARELECLLGPNNIYTSK